MTPLRVCFRVLSLLVFVSTGAVAQSSQASRLAAVPQNRQVGRQMTVLRETLNIDCFAKSERLACSSSSVLEVENALDSLAVFVLEVDPLATSLTVGGKDVTLSTPEGQFVKNGISPLPRGRTEIRVAIPKAFEMDASAQAAEVITPVIVTRHPLLGRYPGRPAGVELTLQSVASSKRWKDVRQTRIVVTYPGDWERLSNIPPCTTAPVTDQGCVTELEDGRVKLEWTTDSEVDNPQGISRLLPLAPEERIMTNGGLLFGLGWGGGGDCLWCLEASRFRLGYEWGINTRDLLGFTVEYSVTERVLLVPTVDRAILPNLGNIPAVTLGVGFPLMVSPEVKAGIRGQVGFTWPLKKTASVGFVGTVDHLLGHKEFRHPVGVGLTLGL